MGIHGWWNGLITNGEHQDPIGGGKCDSNGVAISSVLEFRCLFGGSWWDGLTRGASL